VGEVDLPPHALLLRYDVPPSAEVLQDRRVELFLREFALREAGDRLLVLPLLVQRRVPAVRDPDDRALRVPLDARPPLLPHPAKGDGELSLGHLRAFPQRLDVRLPVGLPE